MKPSTTLRMFIQPPDLGADFSHEGKRANSVNGSARANAKPSMPMAGPQKLPLVAKSTSRKPMMGPVHENDTSARVKAIRKMDSRPLVLLALLSTALDHLLGSLISNMPKNDSAKTTSSRHRKILNTALVESAFRALGPKMAVTMRPRAK